MIVSRAQQMSDDGGTVRDSENISANKVGTVHEFLAGFSLARSLGLNPLECSRRRKARVITREARTERNLKEFTIAFNEIQHIVIRNS